MKVFFDHIPKTAGSSLTLALSNAMGEPPISLMDAHHAAITSAGARNFLAGHFWFAPGERLAAGWYYATVLRNPIDRFISQYFFNRLAVAEQPLLANADPAAGAAARLGLADYLRSDDPAVKRSYSNYQARHFAERKSLDLEDLTQDELFDAAVASLDEYDLAGTFEELPAFLEVLCAENDIQLPLLQTKNKNICRQQVHEFGPDLLERLDAANQVDLRLWAWVTDRFQAKGKQVREAIGIGSNVPQMLRGDRASQQAPAAALSFGNRNVRIVSVVCRTAQGDAMHVRSGQHLEILIDGASCIDEPNLTAGIAIVDETGSTLYGINTFLMGQKLAVSAGNDFRVIFSIRADLVPGTYKVTAALHRGSSHQEGNYDWQCGAALFRVTQFAEHPFVGKCNLSASVNVHEPIV